MTGVGIGPETDYSKAIFDSKAIPACCSSLEMLALRTLVTTILVEFRAGFDYPDSDSGTDTSSTEFE